MAAVAEAHSHMQEPMTQSLSTTKRRFSEEDQEHATKRQRTEPDTQLQANSPREQLREDHGEKSTATAAEKAIANTEGESKVNGTVTSDDKSAPLPVTSDAPENVTTEDRASRRKSGAVDEKQRSRRLFGSLLGTLGQAKDGTTKKRQEIEARRKAELQQQDNALRGERQRRGDKPQPRHRDQRRIEEENRLSRHSSMRDTANFLQTRTRPQLYYRPWELRPSEDRKIENQKRRVEEQIQDELDGLTHRDRSPPVHRRPSTSASTTNLASRYDTDAIERPTNRVDGQSHSPDEVSVTAAAETAGLRSQSPQADASRNEVVEVADAVITSSSDKDEQVGQEILDIAEPDVQDGSKQLLEHDDEHMVEGDEDNVIY